MRRVFLKDENIFADAIDVTITMSEDKCVKFIQMIPKEYLPAVLETQVDFENYEMAKIVKDVIEEK